MSLRSFIEDLKKNGRLTEIDRPVSKEYEAPIISSETKGPVLFENVDGSRTIMNLLGSREELGAMLGVPKEEIIRKNTEKWLPATKADIPFL